MERKLNLFYWIHLDKRDRSIASSYSKYCNGAIIAFDLTNRKSFDRVLDWLNMLKAIANYPIALFGCKCDLIEDREISKEEIEQFSKEYNIPYFETNSLRNYNIKESIETLVNKIFEYLLKKSKNKEIVEKNTNSNNIEKKNLTLKNDIIGFENVINSKRIIGNEILKYDKLNKYLNY